MDIAVLLLSMCLFFAIGMPIAYALALSSLVGAPRTASIVWTAGLVGTARRIGVSLLRASAAPWATASIGIANDAVRSSAAGPLSVGQAKTAVG